MSEAAAPPLADIFRRLIRTTGPISLAHYMAESNARYYATRDPLGTAGDFVTAPEISQMFGELIGLWLADLWLRAGRPAPVHYVELGPGRGTLATDALGAMRQHGLAPQVHFVETSPALRAIQQRAVPGAVFHADLATLPATGSLLIVGNEFLDALPIRQLVRTAQGWRERMVGLVDDDFAYVAGAQPMDAAVPPRWRSATEGTLLETSPGCAAVVSAIAARLAEHGGCALLIDYGTDTTRTGSTFQAVRAHRHVDPLVAPGEADLTAHVDFAVLAQVAQAHGVRWLGTATQGDWLRAMGIALRTEALIARAPHKAADLHAGRDRLTGDDQMGQLFKVMGLAAHGWPPANGFVPPDA